MLTVTVVTVITVTMLLMIYPDVLVVSVHLEAVSERHTASSAHASEAISSGVVTEVGLDVRVVLQPGDGEALDGITEGLLQHTSSMRVFLSAPFPEDPSVFEPELQPEQEAVRVYWTAHAPSWLLVFRWVSIAVEGSELVLRR